MAKAGGRTGGEYGRRKVWRWGRGACARRLMLWQAGMDASAAGVVRPGGFSACGVDCPREGRVRWRTGGVRLFIGSAFGFSRFCAGDQFESSSFSVFFSLRWDRRESGVDCRRFDDVSRRSPGTSLVGFPAAVGRSGVSGVLRVLSLSIVVGSTSDRLVGLLALKMTGLRLFGPSARVTALCGFRFPCRDRDRWPFSGVLFHGIRSRSSSVPYLGDVMSVYYETGGAEPVLRLDVGGKARLCLVSPVFHWSEHYLADQSWLCAESGCPACDLWAPKLRSGALVLSSSPTAGSARLWFLALPRHAGVDSLLPGDVFELARSNRGYRLELDKNVEQTVLPVARVASVVARLFRLPPLDSLDESVVAKWWTSSRVIARRRLTVNVTPESRKE